MNPTKCAKGGDGGGSSAVGVDDDDDEDELMLPRGMRNTFRRGRKTEEALPGAMQIYLDWEFFGGALLLSTLGGGLMFSREIFA